MGFWGATGVSVFNEANISATAHGAFEVDMTISRSGEADRTERGVLHLKMEEWHTHGGTTRPVQLDCISVQSGVDIEPGDVIAVAASTGAVPSDAEWTVQDRLIDYSDRHLVMWRIHEQGTAV